MINNFVRIRWSTWSRLNTRIFWKAHCSAVYSARWSRPPTRANKSSACCATKSWSKCCKSLASWASMCSWGALTCASITWWVSMKTCACNTQSSSASFRSIYRRVNATTSFCLAKTISADSHRRPEQTISFPALRLCLSFTILKP